MFCAPKNNIDFRKIFSWENLFGKSPYYEKRKLAEIIGIPPFFFPQPPNLTQEIAF
jgi:hypothetical protein